jgi:hypothetical protein
MDKDEVLKTLNRIMDAGTGQRGALHPLCIDVVRQ